MYGDRLADMPGVVTPKLDHGTTRMSWFVYVIRLGEGIDRTAVMDRLMANGVPSRPYFVPIHLQPLYRERFGFTEGTFPVAEAIAETTLAIPFYTQMPEHEVDYVVTHIREALEA
jgi:dTDP-4-amino-4,6-dideoxygalactose transaminase